MEQLMKRKYKLNKNVTEKILKDNGFRNQKFQCYIYKDIIKLIVNVDIEENWWNYNVYDENTNSIYAPYYNREYGKNLIVNELDVKIEKIFKELKKRKILFEKNNKRRKMNGEKSSKI